MHDLAEVKLLLKMELDAVTTQIMHQRDVPQANIAASDLFDAAQTVEHQESVGLSISRLARRASEVRSALERVQEGNYGLCEGCGNRIPARRLVAVPTTTTCLLCQYERERGQQEYAHRPSAAARLHSSPVRAGIEDAIARRHLKVRNPHESHKRGQLTKRGVA